MSKTERYFIIVGKKTLEKYMLELLRKDDEKKKKKDVNKNQT